MIAFMNGTINNVVMTDRNHSAKNLWSQLVLGNSIISGGNVIFDVGLLQIAGVSQDLYRVSDYASDVLDLQLCSSNAINKLLNLLVTSSEDPLNISFMVITLYFLRAFICAYNSADFNSEDRVTILWSSLMWFSSLKGINQQTKNNFITSCLGGIFLAIPRRKYTIFVWQQQSQLSMLLVLQEVGSTSFQLTNLLSIVTRSILSWRMFFSLI